MRGKSLVFGFSFAAVALMCLAREPAAQTQQGTQPSQTERVPPDMLLSRSMETGVWWPRPPRAIVEACSSLSQ
jgi:hypothetical protein